MRFRLIWFQSVAILESQNFFCAKSTYSTAIKKRRVCQMSIIGVIETKVCMPIQLTQDYNLRKKLLVQFSVKEI